MRAESRPLGLACLLLASNPSYADYQLNLEPGVTELYIHAAVASDEIKAITNSWRTRDYDYRVFKSAELQHRDVAILQAP